MPHKFVDHTHATAVLGIVDQPDSRAICEEVYDGRMGFVRYIMPGFGLAKEAADVFDENPKVEGLILDKHGIFTFGEDARQAYERMIEMVTLAEARLAKNRKAVFVSAQLPQTRGHACRDRADPARRGRPARSEDRRRLEAAGIRFPHQRCDLEFRQRRRNRTLCASRRDHARPHHPHQELADARARPRRRQARRFPQRARARWPTNSSTITGRISRATMSRAGNRRPCSIRRRG